MKSSKAKKPNSSGKGLTLGKKSKNILPDIDPTTFTFIPTLPKVNTLPSSVSEKYEIKGVMRKAGAAVLGVALIFGLVFAGGQMYVGSLKSQLADLDAQAQALQGEIDVLQPYETYKGAITNKRTLLAAQTQKDVNMGSLLSDIYGAAGQNIRFTDIILEQVDDITGTQSSLCINPDPFATNTDINGCLVLKGETSSPNVATAFVKKFNDGQKYVSPFVIGMDTDNKTDAAFMTKFEVSISYTSAIFTTQYSDLEKPLDEVIAPKTEESTDPEGGQTNVSSPYSTEDISILFPGVQEADVTKLSILAEQACSAIAGNDENGFNDTIASVTNIVNAVTPNGYTEALTTFSTKIKESCGGN